MNPSMLMGPQLPQPQAPDLLSALLQGGGGPQQAPAPQPANLPMPMPAQAAPQDPGLPLNDYGLAIKSLLGSGVEGSEAERLARQQADARREADKSSKENDLLDNIMRGMITGGQTPEQMSKGNVARNAFANFARGVLQKENFKSVQDEERDRKMRELAVATQAARLRDSETKSRLLMAQSSIQNAVLNNIKKQDLERKQQYDQMRYELGQGRLDLGQANLDDKKTMEAWKQHFAELQAQGKAPKTDQELAYFMLQHPDVAPQLRKLYGEVESERKNSHFAPTGGAAKGPILMIPGEDGSYTATQVHPGQTVQPGAVTAAGMSSMAVPTTNTRAMSERAPRVQNFVQRINDLLDANEKQFGPLAGRWNDFASGKIGLPNRGFKQLQTNMDLLETSLMNMHVGARGSEKIMEHFHNMIGGAKQDPENIRAALEEIKRYADEVAKEGGPKTANSSRTNPAPAPQAGSSEDPLGILKGAKK